MPSDSGADRRRAERHSLNLPFQLNGTGCNDVELIDISETGTLLSQRYGPGSA